MQFKALRNRHQEYIDDLGLSRGQPASSGSGIAHWTELAGDGRQLYNRRSTALPSSGASSSNVDLRQNPTANQPLSDKRAYKWLNVPALCDPISEGDAEIANAAYRLAAGSPEQDAFGTIPLVEFMEQLEPHLEKHMGDQYIRRSWRERWRTIIQAGSSISFKFLWLQAQYDGLEPYAPFSEAWWQHVITPLRLKFIGCSTVEIEPEARGVPLPHDFTGTLLHYTCRKHLHSITRWGLLCGRNCGKSGDMCIYLASTEWDHDKYQAATRMQNEGNLELPQLIGFPPKPTQDVRIYINMKRLCSRNPPPDLRQAENFTISCAPGAVIPWNCMEAAVSMEKNSLIWVNPDFYYAYLSLQLVPSDIAATISAEDWVRHAEEHKARQRRNAESHDRVDQLLLDKFRGVNISLCTMCATKEQVGTLWCYLCQRPMIQREPLPIPHNMIQMLVCDHAPDHERGNAPITVGGMTWGQRVLMWRKGCFKKKYSDGTPMYTYTEWPLGERLKYDVTWAQRCNEASLEYLGCMFTRKVAWEADELAYNLWRAEQAAIHARGDTRKGKGKGKAKGKSRGRPVNAATVQATYDV